MGRLPNEGKIYAEMEFGGRKFILRKEFDGLQELTYQFGRLKWQAEKTYLMKKLGWKKPYKNRYGFWEDAK